MTIEQFYTRISEAFPTVPIFFEVIDVEEGDELPPDYMFFESGTTVGFGADNQTYWSSTPIELMAVQTNPIKNDDRLTEELEEFLQLNRFQFTKQVANDTEIRATVTTYTFNI